MTATARVVIVALLAAPGLLPAAASGQTMFIGEPSRGFSISGSLASVDGHGKAPGVSLSLEPLAGIDQFGRASALQLRAGSERLFVGGTPEAGGGYVRRRQVSVGFRRDLAPGPRGAVMPYVFAQLNRQWLVERSGVARVSGVGFGTGVDISGVDA